MSRLRYGVGFMTKRINDTKEKLPRRKALLAIAFAGGVLNSQLPVLSQPETPSVTTDSVVQGIENNSNMTAVIRAFYLLRFASLYLTNSNKSAVEAQFAPMAHDKSARWLFSNPRRGDKLYTSWADQLSLEVHSIKQRNDANAKMESNSLSNGIENSELADRVIQKALSHLDKAPEKFAQLNLYYIASLLFEKTGNTAGTKKCKKVLEEAFKACEQNTVVDEDQIKGLSSILNSKANAFVQVQIPDLNPIDNRWNKQKPVKPFTEMEFQESERLKLRSISLVDKLAVTSHIRRKAHRDLALWYMQLGKTELAEKQKEVLYELVGTKDESILYPRSAGCGHLIWWETQKAGFMGACGMG